MVQSPQKYDRQLRIWGDDGQSLLQRASVCIINATPTATELLKNLVLPGIASFTIVDHHPITPADRAANFFLSTPPVTDASHIPVSRAAHLAQAMHRLNPDVAPAYVSDPPASTFLSTSATAAAFLAPFSLVVLSQTSPSSTLARSVSSACHDLNLPLLYLRTAGLIATMRIQLREHIVHDANNPDLLIPDLRPTSPIPSLATRASSLDLDSLPSTDIAHVPFIILLTRAVSIYRTNHNNALPSTRTEKVTFADIVRSLRPSHAPSDAANFTEALRPTHLRLCHAGADMLPSNLSALLDDAQANPETSTVLTQAWTMTSTSNTCSSLPPPPSPTRPNDHKPDNNIQIDNAASRARRLATIWLHIAAIRAFRIQTGRLPLRGTLPDMTADTKSYTALQKEFQSQAAADVEEVLTHARAIVERLHETNPTVVADRTMLARMCKTLPGARVIRTRSIDLELKEPGKGGFASAVMNDGALQPDGMTSAAPYYAAMRAVDIFESRVGRRPEQTDVAVVMQCLTEVAEGLGVGGGVGGAGSAATVWREHMEELVRYGDVEIHNVAALMGGVAAQEAVKLMTGMFVPVCDTLVVNFAEMTSVSFRA